MSIERAEELKREWTDKFVNVQGGVPELRRFEGLTGRVKTVNMNCRLLVEFETPADISWYDIDPRFVVAVTPNTQSSKTSNQPKAKGERQATVAAEPAVSGGEVDSAKRPGSNPLDAIRKQSQETNSNSTSDSVNPLDATRQQEPVSSSTGRSPLDSIRQQAATSATAATPATTEVQSKITPKAESSDVSKTSASPLEQIRSQSAQGLTDGGQSPIDESGKGISTVASSGSPLDQIRAQGSGSPADTSAINSTDVQTPANDDAAGVDPMAAPPGTNTSSPDVGGSPLDQIRRANASHEDSNQSAHAPADSPSKITDTAETNDVETERSPTTNESVVNSDLGLPSKTTSGGVSADESQAKVSPPRDTETAASTVVSGETSVTTSGGPMDQIRDQASDSDKGEAAVDSAFEQIREQASSELSTGFDAAPLMSESATSLDAAMAPPDTPPTPPPLTNSGDDESLASNEAVSLTQQTLFDPGQASHDPVQISSGESIAEKPNLAGDGHNTGLRTEGEAVEEEIVGVEDPVKATFRGKKLPKKDDLKIVEGIGPKIAQLFNDDGITTWKQLSEASPERLRKILDDAGPRFRMHTPETWPSQAKFADEGKWQELEAYQDHLDGGREPDKD